MAYQTVTVHHKKYPWTSVMASPYNCDNTGTLDCSAKLENLKAYLSNVGEIFFPEGTYLISDNLTIPAGMIIRGPKAVINIAAGKTLTLNGPTFDDVPSFIIANTASLVINGAFNAGLRKVFTDSNAGYDGVVFGAGTVKEVYPEWWATNSIPGTTDMTVAFQCAINSLNNSKGIINLNNSYAFSNSINVNSYIDIKGNGSTLKMLNNIKDGIFYIDTKTDVTIENIIGIGMNDGGSLGPSDDELIIYAKNSSNVAVIFCDLSKTVKCIEFEGCSDSIVSSNLLHNTTRKSDNNGGQGVLVSSGCSNIVVMGNRFKDIDRVGCYFSAGGTNLLCVDNVFETCHASAISVNSFDTEAVLKNVLISNNTINNCLSDYTTVYGIAVTGWINDIIVSNNIINTVLGTGYSEYGINIEGSATYLLAKNPTRILINGNIIKSVGDALAGTGIRVVNATNCEVINNTIYDTKWGILGANSGSDIGSYLTRFKIDGNTVENFTGYAYSIQYVSDQNRVIDAELGTNYAYSSTVPTQVWNVTANDVHYLLDTVTYNFTGTNVAANATTVLNGPGSGITDYIVPNRMYGVYIVGKFNQTITAGNAVITATNNGVPGTLTFTINSASQSSVGKLPIGYAAGWTLAETGVLGVQCVTDASFLPDGTAELSVSVILIPLKV